MDKCESTGATARLGRVLVTGGAGYVGSHTAVALLQRGWAVAVLDNLSNSSRESISRIEQITGASCPLHEVDMLDMPGLLKVFQTYPDIKCVIHFAGLKAVGASVEDPLTYYRNNVMGTINLVEAMTAVGVHDVIFSSSATVYGDPRYLPMDEAHPVGMCTSPYARTKLFVEDILSDICRIRPEWNAMILRYFNPVGAHSSGLIGEDPRGVPNNLTPFVAQVAIGKRPELLIFGDDYNTEDGTGVRDYIHITDLAAGHVAALDHMAERTGFQAYNLGTGAGSSVLQVLGAFERACGAEIPHRVAPRRAGDVAAMCADPTRAHRELGWRATLTLYDMCRDVWNWQKKNPDGYQQTVNNKSDR